MENKFCRKCGGKLDANNKCESCGKQYFKFNKYIFIILLLFLIILGETFYILFNKTSKSFIQSTPYDRIKELSINDINIYTVYITPNGKKYHRHTCSSLSENYKATTISIAQDNGYMPCVKCSPSKIDYNAVEIKNSNTTSTSNAQNDGLTLEEVRAIRQKAVENEKQKSNAQNDGLTVEDVERIRAEMNSK